MENLLKPSLIQEVFPGNAPICEKKQPVRAAFSYVDGVCVDNEALGIENDAVTLQQNQVAAGDNDVLAAADGRRDGILRQTQLADGTVDSGVLSAQLYFDEVDIFLSGVFADALDPGVLVDEACGDNTGGDGDHVYTQEGADDSDDFAHGGDRVDVTIARGQQRRTKVQLYGVEGIEEGDGQVDQQDQRAENIIASADQIIRCTDFNDFRDSPATLQPEVFFIGHGVFLRNNH